VTRAFAFATRFDFIDDILGVAGEVAHATGIARFI
jgi:hypothetical protein